MINLIIFTLIGTCCGIALGTFTGLIPGLHVNAVAMLIIGFFIHLNPVLLASAIMAMAITHTIWDFVPSIFLGAPDEDTALSVLPGHKLLLEGRGYEALFLTVVGGVCAILLSLLLLPALWFLLPFLYEHIHQFMHFILLAIATAMILSAGSWKLRAYSAVLFIISGMLGYLVLDTQISSQGILFPLFTGLFGMSTLIISASGKSILPKQNMSIPYVKARTLLSGTIKALFSGTLVGTLPGVGSAQAAILSQQISRKHDVQEFLISIGGINTVVALISIVSLITISKARSGAAVAISSIMGVISTSDMLLLVAAGMIAAGVSSIILLKSAGFLVGVLRGVDYSKLSMRIIVFLLFLTIVFSYINGNIIVNLLVLFTASSLGILAPLCGVRRSVLMGSLMVPIMLFYANMAGV